MYLNCLLATYQDVKHPPGFDNGIDETRETVCYRGADDGGETICGQEQGHSTGLLVSSIPHGYDKNEGRSDGGLEAGHVSK